LHGDLGEFSFFGFEFGEELGFTGFFVLGGVRREVRRRGAGRRD
jgi:hypothetical protein